MLTSNAIKVLEKRYLLKDNNGKIIETPNELFMRVASAIAEPEVNKNYWTNRFYEAMSSGKFIPNTPCLMNAGTKHKMLSACFVLPVEDSMEGIFDAIKWAALIHKRGGGTGFSFSRLRPKNSVVQSTHGVSSGPVSFMKVFNAATEAVKQGGTRRGANMGILSIEHPDILEFINCKKDLTQVTNFNISVAITDKFMECVKENKIWYFRSPQTGDLIDSGIPAKDLFNIIVENAWASGEPGIIFIDEINRSNPGRDFEFIESTNPCGELPLPPFDVCNLLSINVARFVNKNLTGFDEVELINYIESAVHFLDNLITINEYPIEQIKEQSLKSRRMGLGIMGWADSLIKLKIKYDSDKAVKLGENLMKFIYQTAAKFSVQLGIEKGKVYNLDRRNTTLTMIAPTGTISIIAGCSSGIEPIYSIAYTRNVMEGTRLTEVNPEFEKIAKEEGFYSEQLMQKIADANSIQGFKEIPDWVKDIFRTAADISPEYHILMQSAFQKWCDSAVSKTINLPFEATKEDVEKAYWLAFNLKCKGVTVYRDGSRPGQVLSTGATPESARNTEQIGAFGTVPKQATPKEIYQYPEPLIKADVINKNKHIYTKEALREAFTKSTTKPRPDKLYGFTDKIKTGYGNLYVTVNCLDGKPFEVFATIGKSGFSMMADTEAITRLLSLSFRSGIDVATVVKQLKSIGGSQPVFGDNGLISSIPDAISKVLEMNFIKEKNEHIVFGDISKERCPDCEAIITHKEGCLTCDICGYSKC